MTFDIIIVGGGHAGVEAAYIASQFTNLNIGLISMPGVGLASAPCNPSVGGVGKGQVVRELDALGGLMGKLADLSGLQYRTLNESKGYAVQSTRVQIDKVLYTKNAEIILSEIPNLTIIREKISKIQKIGEGFVVLSDDNTWDCQQLIVTIGTFLNGKLHTGDKISSGGRVGCETADSLNSIFSEIRTLSQRFKTGTPARLEMSSINYNKLEEQPSDESVETFHVLHGTNKRFISQKSCYLAYTNSETMKVIRDNKEKSPMFNGQINAIGARYCPSIEDKAYRYPDKDKHHVFIEPESHYLNTVYPSGISTSLPQDVQGEMVSSISGLEDAEICEYGYAVEYDVIETTQLNTKLEMKDIPGLYFAGQVNGTSGYEEAAGQGYIAGVNAALSCLKEQPLVLSRKDSYIGVMIEDLVTNLRDEPYRLFTARSEDRLYNREDNSIVRMAKYRRQLGFNLPIDRYIDKFLDDREIILNLLKQIYIDGKDGFVQESNIKVPRRTSLAELIKKPELDPVKTLLSYLSYCGLFYNERVVKTVAIEIKYEGYIEKSNVQSNKQTKLEMKQLNLEAILSSENVSFECKQRIEKIRPETFGQLKRMEGIRPASLAIIASQL